MFFILFIEIATAILIGGMIRWLFELVNLFGALSEFNAITITFIIFFFLIAVILMILNIWKKKVEKKREYGKQFLDLDTSSKSCANCKKCKEPQSNI